MGQYVTGRKVETVRLLLDLPLDVAKGIAECINTYADGGVDDRPEPLRAAVDEVAREIEQEINSNV